MRIAQIAPLAESVPPKLYGGTERVVSVLTEELVRRGHEVTLYASADSQTTARLKPCADQGLRLSQDEVDPLAYCLMQLASVFDAEKEYDIIHNHIDYVAFPFARRSAVPVVSTTHGRLDLPETRRIYEYFSDVPLVSISHEQRTPLPNSKWAGNVYNAIDIDCYEFQPEKGSYLAFLGRVSPEKRVDRAIEVARSLEIPLKIAAKIDDSDKDYFEHAIKPFLDSSLIEFVGEVDDAQKNDFLGKALAYLFPIDWPEPFGLTMVEAMACGTPVVAMEAGSVPEVVVDGVSGFVCPSFREFIEMAEEVQSLDRLACRRSVEERFSPKAMADGYEQVYQDLMND